MVSEINIWVIYYYQWLLLIWVIYSIINNILTMVSEINIWVIYYYQWLLLIWVIYSIINNILTMVSEINIWVIYYYQWLLLIWVIYSIINNILTMVSEINIWVIYYYQWLLLIWVIYSIINHILTILFSQIFLRHGAKNTGGSTSPSATAAGAWPRSASVLRWAPRWPPAPGPWARRRRGTWRCGEREPWCLGDGSWKIHDI